MIRKEIPELFTKSHVSLFSVKGTTVFGLRCYEIQFSVFSTLKTFEINLCKPVRNTMFKIEKEVKCIPEYGHIISLTEGNI